MEKAALVILFILFACTTSMVQCTSDKSIFILAGQSNMVGQGELLPTPPECQSNPQILRLNNNSQWEIAREPLRESIGLKNTKFYGIGPGMPFTNGILKPGETIGLVPCAMVATYLDQWKRGTTYYNWTLDQARAAVSNGGGTIRALLWYQGESETDDETSAKSYKGRIEQFFTDFRNDVQLPSLPILQVALASGHRPELMEIVREAQLNLRLPKVYTVDALKLKPTLIQNIYLDTPSEVKLGKELASVFRSISTLV